MEERFRLHKTDKNCSLYLYVNGDWDNWFIELYENYPCKNKYILELRETEVQRQIATINKQLARRTHKQYHQDNREKILEYQKQRYKDNSDEILKKQKEYYQDNRNKRLEYQKQKIICERCGTISDISHIKRHQQTQKCLNYNVDNN